MSREEFKKPESSKNLQNAPDDEKILLCERPERVE
jgi:hypothetical protein